MLAYLALGSPCVLPPASEPSSCAHTVPEHCQALLGLTGFLLEALLTLRLLSGGLACLPLCSGCSGPSPVWTGGAVVREE